MKKLVVLSLLCLFSMASMAQSLPINIGIHVGWNDTKISAHDFKMSARSGYMFGAFVRLNLGTLYLEPALNYSHRESKAETGSIESKLKYSSIDIPVMVGLHLVNATTFKLRGFAGPVVSFLTKDVKLSKDSGYFDADKTMWSGKIGVGVDVWKFTFDMDYEFGFKKFGDGVKTPNTFGLTLGFKII